MELRLAEPADLPGLEKVYRAIVREMEARGLLVWDEEYPCCCFPEDIENGRLHVLAQGREIAGAFALCLPDPGPSGPCWSCGADEALELARLGVCVERRGQGLGSLLIRRAAALAREAGKRQLRLLVVDGNRPAIAFYEKNGFRRVEGFYDNVVDKGLTLREYGYEFNWEEQSW